MRLSVATFYPYAACLNGGIDTSFNSSILFYSNELIVLFVSPKLCGKR